MDWQMAKINLKNFLRLMVGAPKIYPVKVLRDERAKRYPLIHIKKRGDVGYDLASVERVVVPPGERALIPTGIRLEMPENIWCSIEARSSASAKMLITPDAIIDSGYRGELFAVVFNLGKEPYTVEPGERIVQIIFHERVLADVQEVDSITPSERGESGFGSTGK